MTDIHGQVRVRMAPGPTGPFHLGRSRTALINWLFARRHNGVFVLRIEDTDQKRSRPEHLESILDSLRWMGLDWDEGPVVGGPYEPYFQMARLDVYREYIQRLVAAGKAYRCYCTTEELDTLRAQANAERRAFRYPRTCRNLTESERQAREDAGRTWVLRLALDDGGTIDFDDMVLGPISVRIEELDDFVIVKTDGVPTYNFAVVVDDASMHITHVIRGQDHVPNTPKQIAVYQHLGEPIPRFAHLPLVVGLEGEKISARHGAEAVSVWGTTRGYLPDAVINYLATIGISYREGDDILSREELIELFDLAKVGRSRSKADDDKLDWMNGVYIRNLPVEEFVRRSLPFLQQRELISTPPSPDEIARATAALSLEQERVRTLAETPDAVEFFLRESISYDPASLVARKSSREDARRVLAAALNALDDLKSFSAEELEPHFRALAERLELGAGVVFGTLRVAITGRTKAPPLFDTMAVLGSPLVRRRLAAALELLDGSSDSLE